MPRRPDASVGRTTAPHYATAPGRSGRDVMREWVSQDPPCSSRSESVRTCRIGDHARSGLSIAARVHPRPSSPAPWSAAGAGSPVRRAASVRRRPGAARRDARIRSTSPTRQAVNTLEQITTLQQLLRVRHDKTDPAQYAGQLKMQPWTVKVDGLVDEARRLRRRGSGRFQVARGARLSPSLRRRLVDGDAVDWRAARRAC